MKVILTRDVPKLGRDGEIVAVADGYARNYLFPRQLALVAKGAALKQHEDRVAREVAKASNLLTTAQAAAEKLNGQEFQILAKASAKSTRLFGSVTEADVAEKIKDTLGVDVDKRKISLIDPIKIAGKYALTAKLHPEVVVPFSIDVVTQEILDQRERERQHEADRLAKAAAKVAAAEAAAAAAAAEKQAPSESASAE
jgi:large subunit ribosomal protein L9